MTRLAVFDCDGTLVDGQADVCWSMEQAFDRAGLPAPDANRVRRLVGLSLPVAVRELAPNLAEEEAREVVGNFKTIFRNRREEGLLHEPLYDGIADLLHALHGDGWSLAVATGKSDRGLTACLATHGLTELFVSLQTADRHPSKPHPAMLEAALFEAGADPRDTVMIGDTSFDMHMAVAARVPAIGVAWGYHAPEELRGTGAERVAEHVDDLRAMLIGGGR
ncbi:HAD-IA family hydrolase [Erythrobacter sp. YT30]|uniref:HAD-IA family hydrolase n=1 Tax=Erythrobacter sp. YT30 TaxID=1735012 RepID=UPI00076D6052|nr:HAD-IA family hydrolase [Erythrobacter sp. YT30]KWV90606.1 haloacid dehalogenase [Erythrobacter sp. YT30]